MGDDNLTDFSHAPSADFSSDGLKNKILKPAHWIRLLLMVLMYVILFSMIQFIVTISLLVQWVLVLLTGETNTRLRHFTKGLNRYAYQIMEFINFNSDIPPFPLSDWPESNE